jgi:hypothetical protein
MVEEGVHRHEKASKRLTSLQAMSPATERGDTASPPDLTRYKLLEMERARLLHSADITLPKIFSLSGTRVSTKNKLQSERLVQ